MGRGKAKGGEFERQICKELSLWWTEGEHDEVFWRSPSSGGRASRRSQKNQRAIGHGDVQALDSIGKPLLDVTTIEVKRGYKKDTLIDCLDRKEHATIQTWEGWIEQAVSDSTDADTPYWMIISRRDLRDALISMPEGFFEGLLRNGACSKEFVSSAMATIPVRCDNYFDEYSVTIFTTRLELFFEHVHPEVIMELSIALGEDDEREKVKEAVETASNRIWHKQQNGRKKKK